MHTNTIVISVHTNTESYTYTHEMKVQRRNGKTPIWDAVWYSAVDIKAIPRTLSSSALYCCQVWPVHADVVCHS